MKTIEATKDNDWNYPEKVDPLECLDLKELLRRVLALGFYLTYDKERQMYVLCNNDSSVEIFSSNLEEVLLKHTLKSRNPVLTHY